MMVDDFLEKPNWITHNTWRFLKAAADIIDKEGMPTEEGGMNNEYRYSRSWNTSRLNAFLLYVKCLKKSSIVCSYCQNYTKRKIFIKLRPIS
ncbi:MAG: hypothetical protein ACLR0U_29220 [Enterocloster clostridioformis]